MTFSVKSLTRKLPALLLSSALVAASPVGIAPVVAQETRPDWGVVFDALNLKLGAPDVAVTNSSISEGELKSILAGNVAPLVDKMLTWDADRVEIPEITASITIPGEGAEGIEIDVLYQDVVFENISDGVAETFTIGRTITKLPGQVSESSNTVLRNAKVFYNWDWLTGQRVRDTAWQTVYSDFSIESSATVAEEMKCSTGATSMGAVQAKPLVTPVGVLFGAVKTLIEQAQAAEAEGASDAVKNAPPDPEALDTLIGVVIELGQSIKSSTARVQDYECAVEADGVEMQIAFGEMSVGPYQADLVYPDIGMANTKIAFEGNDIAVGSATIKAIDLNGLLETLDSVDGKFSEEWAEANARKLIPEFGGIAVTDLAANVENPEGGGRVDLKLTSFDLTLGNYVSGIPTSIQSTVRDLDTPIPPDGEGEEPNPLTAAGVERINLSYDFDLKWDETSETLNVHALNIDAKDLGRIEAKFEIGNAKAEMFNSPPNLAQLLAMAMTAKSITLRVEDYGVIGLVTEQAAKEEGAPPEAMRGAIAGMAGGMISGLLGADAEELALAVQDFLQESKTFTVKLTSKTEGGLGLAQIITIQSDPTKLADAVTIEVSE